MEVLVSASASSLPPFLSSQITTNVSCTSNDSNSLLLPVCIMHREVTIDINIFAKKITFLESYC